MKRSLAIIAALLLGAAAGVAAQSQGGLGIKGGLSYGNVSNRGVLPGSLRGRTGFAVGVSAITGGFLGLGVEGLYAQRGVISANDPDSRKLDYIDVPAYVRMGLPTMGLTPFAYAGPQVSFELRCRTGSGDCPSTDRPKTTFAAVIGGGVRLGAQGGFTVEGRYIYGLTDLKLSTITSSQSYQTRSFLLLGGLSF